MILNLFTRSHPSEDEKSVNEPLRVARAGCVSKSFKCCKIRMIVCKTPWFTIITKFEFEYFSIYILHLTIIRLRQGDYRRIFAETKSR